MSTSGLMVIPNLLWSMIPLIGPNFPSRLSLCRNGYPVGGLGVLRGIQCPVMGRVEADKKLGVHACPSVRSIVPLRVGDRMVVEVLKQRVSQPA